MSNTNYDPKLDAQTMASYLSDAHVLATSGTVTPSASDKDAYGRNVSTWNVEIGGKYRPHP